MTCSLCPKVALYKAGDELFCKDHHGNAVTRSTAIGVATQSRKSTESYQYEIYRLYRQGVIRATL